ncbi:MAG: ectonucleotide pyrophosphatase/phosphodiesterase [Pyrinomonadaceae bacterium]|nr:ectonucleotide pyrophosphatase/phosphodiesterase [Pyrinomonadaceae bacterium]
MKKPILIIFCILLCGSFVFGQKPVRDLSPTVILISLDGFRYDYVDKYKPKTLSKLAKNGVRAKWMIPSFPTKTFPNHYTVATGLYPEHHGIIENNIYDFGTVFTLSKREEVQNSRWWLGEPIWVTAEKQGQRAGAFFFPGTEAEIGGKRPTFWKEYDGKIANETRVDQILSWLDLPKNERPTIFTLYFSDTDDAGHKYSPDSDELKNAVKKVDGDLKRLINGLKKRKINKKVNLIIVSDHGMATVKTENSVILDDYFDFKKTDRILWTGEIVQIFPKEGEESSILTNLRKLPHATCWKKSEIPERLHYRASPRIAPIVCSAEEGWYLTSNERLEERKKRDDWGKVWGAHGYDNKYQSMQATFIAHGEALKKGLLAEPFENIQVYNLMCNILGLNPAPNDGDFMKVMNLLKNPKIPATTVNPSR